MNILKKLELHQVAYEAIGEPVPVFRITCAEHKELLAHIDKYFPGDKKSKLDLVSEYYGIPLKLIVEVERYWL